MGCDFYVNIGPVVVINNPPRDTIERHVSCCNDKCKQFHKYGVGKFCPDCGSPIQDWLKPVFKPLDIDFYTLLKQNLMETDHERQDACTVILKPNRNSREVGHAQYNLKQQPFEHFPKVDEMVSSVEKFKELFQDELNILKETFGVENVDVRYGTIGTISC